MSKRFDRTRFEQLVELQRARAFTLAHLVPERSPQPGRSVGPTRQSTLKRDTRSLPRGLLVIAQNVGDGEENFSRSGMDLFRPVGLQHGSALESRKDLARRIRLLRILQLH